MTEAATRGVLRNFAKFTGNQLCQSLFFNKSKVAGLRPATLLKKRPWHKYILLNFSKVLRTPFLQNISARLLLKWNKTKCLLLLITLSSLSDINTTLKIGITITWSFTLRYVIATASLWCWKKISYNDVTSISIRNRSISRCKSNKKPMSPQYRVPTGRNKKLSFLVSPLLAYITPRFKRCFNAIVLFQLMKQEWKRQALNRSLINTAQKLVSQKLGFSIKWLLKYSQQLNKVSYTQKKIMTKKF